MKKAILGFVVAVISAAVLALLLTGGGAFRRLWSKPAVVPQPPSSQTGLTRGTQQSQTILDEIGTAVSQYADAHGGQLPPSVQQVLPQTGTSLPPSPFGQPPDGGDGIWIRPDPWPPPADSGLLDQQVLAYDRGMYAVHTEVNVLFGNGHVKTMPVRDFDECLKRAPNHGVDFKLPKRPSNRQEPVETVQGTLIESVGIEAATLSEAMRQRLGLALGVKGVQIVHVVSGSGAERAGLHEGMVVESVWWRAVDDIESVKAKIAGSKPGDQVTMGLWVKRADSRWDRQNFIVQLGGPAPTTGKTDSKPGNLSYTVKPGDSLAAIAKAHGVSVADLERANNLTGNQIRVGQELTIPTSHEKMPSEVFGATAVGAQESSSTQSGTLGLPGNVKQVKTHTFEIEDTNGRVTKVENVQFAARMYWFIKTRMFKSTREERNDSSSSVTVIKGGSVLNVDLDEIVRLRIENGITILFVSGETITFDRFETTEADKWYTVGVSGYEVIAGRKAPFQINFSQMREMRR